ncbi:MAG: hypothetical protein SH820_14145 [Xanthomonadales bacterium]|nr:hypothetical protein [Xanthomonadales bacterium]
MNQTAPILFLLDVDNTVLDNDRVVDDSSTNNSIRRYRAMKKSK